MKLVVRISTLSLFAAIVGLSFLFVPCTAVAQSKPTAFEKAIHEDVVAVVSFDLTKIDLSKFKNWASELGLFPEGMEAQLTLLTDAQSSIDKLTENSVRRISILYRLSDVRADVYSPMWVATIAEGGDIDQATETLKETLDTFQLDKRAMQARDGLIFGGPSDAEIDSLFIESDAENRQLSGALKMMDQYTAGIFIFGNEETRRVVREMLPDLPKPFNEATRELIADHTDWVGLFLDLPPTADLKLIFQASDKEAAQTIGRLSTAAVGIRVEENLRQPSMNRLAK